MIAERTLPAIAAALLSLCSTAALAQSIDYDPRRDPALRPCDDHRYRGRADEAKACYTRLLDSSDNVLVGAESAWALGNMERANQLFRQAATANRRSAQARVRWGQLFLQTHQYADATTLFNEALQVFPNEPYATVGLAQVYAERFEGEARALVEKLLKEDEQIFDAHLLSARMSLEEGKLDAADAALDRAEKIADSRKLPPLEIYSLRAVLDATRGRGPDPKDAKRNQWVNRTLTYNPRYGAIYEELAHFEVMRRRYTQATELLRRAVEVQPDLWSAQAELGANLLRLGDLNEARKHLTAAYSGDPYSPTTVNSLRLLDRVDEFDVTSSKVAIPAVTGGGEKQVDVRLRMHRKEADALRPYVLELTRDSIATFSRRYGFEPAEPVTVELYSDHDDFAVRVAALPGIGLLGVTFGYLVAMDSPSGRATGDFHWGSTLWHEMAHVFTLEATDHRVPRWLSEGISVFEEWRTGPTPGIVVTPDAITALKDNKLLPVADLDSGFIRPRYPDQVQVSYMQSGLICLFIEQRWGFDKLVALLRQFTRDTTTAAAIEATFKIAPVEFDKQFDAFVRERYKTLLPRLDEYQKSYDALRKAVAAQQWNDAIAPARKAVEIYPEHIGSGSPYLLLAQALEKSGQRPEAIATLEQYRKAGGWDPAALRELAAWLETAGRKDEATELLLAINYVDPLAPDQHARLGERLLSAGKAADSLREYQVLLALSPHDTAPANFGMARALQTMGDTAASRRHVLDALAAAPHYKPAQALLLQLIEERKNNE
jgi:tetratricopeptide (TPR) repeat protein